MGCLASCAKDGPGPAPFRRRNTIVVKPQVELCVGKGINLSIDGTKVIFIFGGPGSGKGTIVDNLIDMFQLNFICGEDLILQNLRKKLIPDDEAHKNVTSNNATLELAQLLQDHRAELTLTWVLQMIQEEIKKYAGGPVLVDVMPNLKFLLRVEGFVTSACHKEMEVFEDKYPVSLAINLDLDKEYLIQNINTTHACVRAPNSGHNGEENGDELDASKTQRRFELYARSVRNFIAYFRSRDKLLSVDTSCGIISSVWESIQDYVIESGVLQPLKALSVVILFVFDEHERNHIDFERYPFHDIALERLVPDLNVEPVELLKGLGRYIDENAGYYRLFMVYLANTPITRESVDKFVDPEVMFVSVDVGQLDYFVHGLERKTKRKKSVARKKSQIYKAVCSTDNETLLFSTETDTELCRRIAICLRNSRLLGQQ